MIELFEEKKLVSALKNGSYEAFDALYMAYSPLVERFAYALLKNRSEVEDLSQNVFLKLWEIRSRLDSVNSFRSYLFTMVRNAIIDVLSKRKTSPDINLLPEAVLKDVSSADVLSSIDARKMGLIINMAVSLMPEQRRKVFIMSRKEGASHKEIAASLGISVKTVEYHISKALSTLREIVEKSTVSVSVH